jgi:hypothetical protein
MRKTIFTLTFCLSTAFTFSQVSFQDVNGKFGFKLNDKIIVDAKYDSVYAFWEGLAIVEINKKYGFIDVEGNEIIEIKYDMVRIFYENIAAVKYNGLWGFIDKSEKIIIPFKYFNAHMFFDEMSLVTYRDNESHLTYTYVNKEGIELPARFDGAEDFKDGLAVVLFNWFYGVIDNTGKIIVKPKYTKIHPFEDDIACVELGDNPSTTTSGYIDKKGNEILKPMYRNIDKYEEGFIVFNLDEGYGVFDSSGQEIIEQNIKYKIITYKDGYFYVTLRDYETKELKYDKLGNLIE